MWTIITCSKIGPGVQLDIEVMASFCSNHGIETTPNLDFLPTDSVWEQVGCRLVRHVMLHAEIGWVGKAVRCCGLCLRRCFLGRLLCLQCHYTGCQGVHLQL